MMAEAADYTQEELMAVVIFRFPRISHGGTSAQSSDACDVQISPTHHAMSNGLPEPEE
jgi:hypothetical protein